MRDAWRAWRDRWARWRDATLSNPSFHAWAAQAPIVRLFARREARAMFDLCAGFVYSQVLGVIVRLDVLEQLRHGPVPMTRLRASLPLPPEGAQVLLDAAIALRLLELRGRDAIGLGPRGAVLLANPGLRAMVLHHEMFYADLQDPLAVLRGERHGTRLGQYWAYAQSATPGALDEDAVARYSALMSVSQDMVSQAVIHAYDFTRHRRLLDIGGGEGRFVINVLDSAPALEGVVFDLPAVAARALARLEAAGHAARADSVGGNFVTDALPAGADVVTLVRVLHDHDDEPARRLLRNIRAALPDGGRLVIAEPMIERGRGDVVGAAYFGMYLKAMGSGRPRTPEEVRRMLGEAGFAQVDVRPTSGPLPLTLVIASVN